VCGEGVFGDVDAGVGEGGEETGFARVWGAEEDDLSGAFFLHFEDGGAFLFAFSEGGFFAQSGYATFEVGLHVVGAFVLRYDAEHVFKADELFLGGFGGAIFFFGFSVFGCQVCRHGFRLFAIAYGKCYIV